MYGKLLSSCCYFKCWLWLRMLAAQQKCFEEFGDGEIDFEDRIHNAVLESIAKQSYLPVLKQELQCKIQYDRLLRGEPELILEEEPEKVYELTEEEIEKRNVRLEQNRRSALRSRRRSKEKEETLKQRVDSLFCEQRRLTKELKELKEEKKITLAKLKAHLGTCKDRKKRNRLSHHLILHSDCTMVN